MHKPVIARGERILGFWQWPLGFRRFTPNGGSDSTVVPWRSARMMRARGRLHTMSLPMDGEVSNGTPATTRDAVRSGRGQARPDCCLRS